MKIWIPGANGLLGATLAKRTPCIATTRADVDIANIQAVQAFMKANPGITHIVNCAAFSLVDAAENRREEAYAANATGPENLAHIAAQISARLIHISSDYVFSGEGHQPLKETDPTNPCNYYGVTKLEGERAVERILPSACIIRTSWIFGQGGKNFVAKLLQMMQEQKQIRLTNDQRGRPTYAPDLADAILDMLDQSGIYHFANEGAATKYEFGQFMWEEARALGYPLVSEEILPVPGSTFSSPCKRPLYSVFDTTKINREIRPWRSALKEYLCSVRLSVCS